MRVRWLDDSKNDLKDLRRYIAQDNPRAARSVVKKVLFTVELLADQPELGRQGRIVNTRELIIASTPYIVPYRFKNGAIEILRVFHCSMQWPSEL